MKREPYFFFRLSHYPIRLAGSPMQSISDRNCYDRRPFVTTGAIQESQVLFVLSNHLLPISTVLQVVSLLLCELLCSFTQFTFCLLEVLVSKASLEGGANYLLKARVFLLLFYSPARTLVQKCTVLA